VHPFQGGFVFVGVAFAGAGVAALGVGAGDGVADVNDDAGAGVALGRDGAHRIGVLPALGQRRFLGRRGAGDWAEGQECHEERDWISHGISPDRCVSDSSTLQKRYPAVAGRLPMMGNGGAIYRNAAENLACKTICKGIDFEFSQAIYISVLA
jgi:hypothetical protein